MDDLKLDYQKIAEKISQFLKKEFNHRNKAWAVLGLSGGVDSSVTAFLCKKAGLNLQTIFMPYGKLSKDSKIGTLGLFSERLREVDITQAVDSQIKLTENMLSAKIDKVGKGNIMARTRMIVQYTLARSLDGLVVGTENLSEYYLGYFTLYGDEACDISPIAGLFKTQVIELAKYLGVPSEIFEQEPSAELYDGQTDKEELGFSYQEADPILYLYCLRKISLKKIIDDFGFEADLVKRVVDRVKSTEHKRQEAPKYEAD